MKIDSLIGKSDSRGRADGEGTTKGDKGSARSGRFGAEGADCSQRGSEMCEVLAGVPPRA